MEALFYIFCTTIPSHIIPFTLFWDFPWRSKKAALTLVFCNVLCKMLTASYYIINSISFRNAELLFAAVGFFIYIYFLDVDFFKLLFTYILIVDYLLVIRGIASFLAIRFFFSSSHSWVSSILSILLYSISLPLLIRFFKKIANQVYRTNAPYLWQTVWLIPAILSVLTLAFTNSYLESSAGSYFFFFCRICLIVCIFIIYHVLLQTLENLQKQIILEQQIIFEKHLMKIQIEEQKKHSLLIMENAEQIRQLRHDLRHHLIAIQAMVDDENLKLKEYINTLLHSIPAVVKDYCENPTVNAIISHYSAICQREKIDFISNVVLPAHNLHITDNALCVIFGNLLENAVEACYRMTDEKKFIYLNSRLEHGILTITMDNSFQGILTMQNEKFYSSKRDGVGIGISSIQSIAKEYQGNARFEAEDKVFHSSVYVKM